jgi:ADP-ribose pyrophosphatase
MRRTMFRLPPPRLRKWQLGPTRTVGQYRIFDVLSHTLRDPDGNPRRDVFTFGCADWCNVVAITEAKEIILIWQYRFGTDAIGLETPGGVIDAGEEPLSAARRELLEETGYEAASWTKLAVVEPNPAIENNRCHFFLAEGARFVQKPSFDELEDCELVLAPADKVADLLDGGQITHALVILALERYLRTQGR